MKYFKSILSVSVVLFASLLSACSDNGSSAEYVFDASVVCPAEGTNAYGDSNRGTFTDARDGHVYKYTTIGNRVWMAENLNYDDGAGGSSCAVKDDCSSKGRFYGLAKSLGVCPEGWHLPSNDEWFELFNNIGGVDSAGLRLKATAGWTPLNPGQLSNGTDDCGFTLLPTPTVVVSSKGYGSNVYDGYETQLWATDVALIEAGNSLHKGLMTFIPRRKIFRDFCFCGLVISVCGACIRLACGCWVRR